MTIAIEILLFLVIAYMAGSFVKNMEKRSQALDERSNQLDEYKAALDERSKALDEHDAALEEGFAVLMEREAMVVVAAKKVGLIEEEVDTKPTLLN